MSTIYEDVATLKEQMAAVQASLTDSGWINLPLAEGIIAYSDTQTPRYRKIGNKVYLKGTVKNVLASGVIGTLPEGFRPNTTAHIYLQNTSIANGHANFSRCVVETSGAVEIEGISDGASFGADKWFPIHTEFLVD